MEWGMSAELFETFPTLQSKRPSFLLKRQNHMEFFVWLCTHGVQKSVGVLDDGISGRLI